MHMVRRIFDGRLFACKIVNERDTCYGMVEVEIMKRVPPHEHILGLLDSFVGRTVRSIGKLRVQSEQERDAFADASSSAAAPSSAFGAASVSSAATAAVSSAATAAVISAAPVRAPISWTTNVCVVTDYARGSDLLNAMNVRGHCFTDLESKLVMARLLDAVRHMHAAGVMHRDIKLENVLIENVGDVTSIKLADFGFAAVCDPSSAPSLKEVYGTPQYVAPEIMMAQSYGNKADMWSLGVLMFIMMTGVSPFSSKRLDDRSRVPFGDPKCKHLSEGAKDLMRRLLNVDPTARLSAKDALAHPWLYV